MNDIEKIRKMYIGEFFSQKLKQYINFIYLIGRLLFDNFIMFGYNNS